MRSRIAPLCLALLAPPVASQVTYHRVALGELELVEGELPALAPGRRWERRWDEMAYRLPYASVEGGEAWVHLAGFDPHRTWGYDRDLGEAELCVRAEAPGEVRGTLFLPTATWDAMTRASFRIPAGVADPEAEQAFQRAEAWHYEVLAARRLPGGAWFRHRLGESAGELPRTLPAPEPVEAFALFSGGRAVSENLQLDRALPEGGGSEEPGGRAVDALEGITVRAHDWGEEGRPAPELDPLAALLPEDQHALFFPSFAALVRVVDEAEDYGVPFAEGLAARAASAGTRRRLERQLCLALDELTRALGPRFVASVAVTGSDPYWRSGSDVAVLLEPAAAEGEALGALLAARQELALEIDGTERVEGSAAGVPWSGVVTPDRAVCSYLARAGEAWLVTNSRVQLERVLGLVSGAAGPTLAEAPEYRSFRRRYPRGEGESAFLMLSDATIRRWCGPRWRIGARRRVLAAARLAELQARHADAVLGRAEPPEELAAEAAALGFDRGPAALGELAWHAGGVCSERWGSLSFLTPIAELELGEATAEEERLYGLWREGYQRNWSAFFDPIALRARLGEGGEGELDLSVVPLILESDYGELASVTGDARLAPRAAGYHPGTLVAFAMALDTQGELLREIDASLAGMMGEAGVSVLDWLGGGLGLWVEPSPVFEDLAAADDLAQALEDLWVDHESVPLVLQLDVKSPLKLAAFLVALRTLADGTAPGATTWETRSHGEERYVRVGSDLAADDFALYYATPQGAFLLAISESTLKRTLDRRAAEREAEGEAEPGPGWLGESVALEVDGSALAIVSEALEGSGDPLRRVCWNNLPALNEWRRSFPGGDPVEVHAALWGEEPACPGGGRYARDEAWRSEACSVHGHPGEPLRGPGLPAVYRGLAELCFGLTLEDEGLRARARWRRAEEHGEAGEAEEKGGR